jgi:phosphatidylglycerol:prolipoprotein diacylglycerol transferase
MSPTHHYLHQLSPFIVQFGEGFGLRWYGFMYVAAFLIGYRLYRYLSERGLNPLEPKHVDDFITWAAVFGVLLGGRLGYKLLYDWENLLADPVSLIRVWEGGMASHGGIIGLVLYTLWYSRKHGLSWTGIGDSLVTVAPIGLFLVRMANFINGELYGRPTQIRWAVQFPSELRESTPLLERFIARMGLSNDASSEVIERAMHSEAGIGVLREVLTPRHPSQIYEGLLEGVALFVVLWVLRTRCAVPRGVCTGAFFICYAGFRIVGEMFRQPEDFNFGMSRGSFLSLFLILIGIAFLVDAIRRPEWEKGLRRE